MLTTKKIKRLNILTQGKTVINEDSGNCDECPPGPVGPIGIQGPQVRKVLWKTQTVQAEKTFDW